jgi:UDP-N-acetylmuramoyl-L-alanyl-D-glutamate--2,6-diaminopimelate ligase
MASALSRLAEVADGEVVGDEAVTVTDATHDSRQAGAGTLYVAMRGSRHDGHRFVAAAVGAGSPAVCVDHPVDTVVPQLLVADTRRALAPIAAEVHGHPSQDLELIGVTGTNGKTTVTHLLEAIGAASGRVTGLIGTVQTRVGGRLIPNPRTTPEASDFQRILRLMADSGASMVAAEVSSHALALGRVGSTRFAVGAFTNLTQDHLDFHPDMEAYFAAKARLVEMAEKAVVWVDDPYGRRLLDLRPDALTVGEGGEVRAEQVESTLAGSRFGLILPDARVAVTLPIAAEFNVANALVAAACAWAVGIRPDDIAAGLGAVAPVPGRFELVSQGYPVPVIVDYAHTPDGIANAVQAGRRLASGRVIVVFGAGGDRDTGKRRQMGEAASAADLVVVTSDNPRSEDPGAIVDQVLEGVDKAERMRIVDRRLAVREALAAAKPGDMVLVLGRGHERGQEVAGRMIPLDDRLVVREELARLAEGGSR